MAWGHNRSDKRLARQCRTATGKFRERGSRRDGSHRPIDRSATGTLRKYGAWTDRRFSVPLTDAAVAILCA